VYKVGKGYGEPWNGDLTSRRWDLLRWTDVRV